MMYVCCVVHRTKVLAYKVKLIFLYLEPAKFNKLTWSVYDVITLIFVCQHLQFAQQNNPVIFINLSNYFILNQLLYMENKSLVSQWHVPSHHPSQRYTAGTIYCDQLSCVHTSVGVYHAGPVYKDKRNIFPTAMLHWGKGSPLMCILLKGVDCGD